MDKINRYKAFMRIFFLSLVFMYPFVSAFSVDIPQDIIKAGGNYSINVNNTEHLEGRDTSQLYTYFESLFDLVYCKLTGCTMNGDLDMDENDITNVTMLNLTTVSGACNLTAGAGISKNSTHYCFA